jgi:hypothetical protein
MIALLTFSEQVLQTFLKMLSYNPYIDFVANAS